MGELVPKSEPLTGSAHLHPGHLSPQPGEARWGGFPGQSARPCSPLTLVPEIPKLIHSLWEARSVKTLLSCSLGPLSQNKMA